MIELSAKGFLVALLFCCPLVGMLFFQVRHSAVPWAHKFLPPLCFIFSLTGLGLFSLLTPFQWAVSWGMEKKYLFMFDGILGWGEAKIMLAFLGALALCGFFYALTQGREGADTRRYFSYLSLFFLFFLVSITARSFFPLIISLGGLSIISYLINAFLYEDAQLNQLAFIRQILEFFALFFCLAWGFPLFQKMVFPQEVGFLQFLPFFFLILQKVDVVGFNFWRKQKSFLSNFYFIFQKNFFLLIPITVYVSREFPHIPEAMRGCALAFGVFHFMSAYHHIPEGLELRGLIESLFRFFGGIFLISLGYLGWAENAIGFLVFSSFALTLLFLADGALEALSAREEEGGKLPLRSVWLLLSFLVALMALVAGIFCFVRIYLLEANIFLRFFYAFIMAIFSALFCMRWGGVVRQVQWKSFRDFPAKGLLTLCMFVGGMLFLAYFFYGMIFSFQQKYLVGFDTLGVQLSSFFFLFSLIPFCVGVALKEKKIYRPFYGFSVVGAFQKAEESFSAAYEYILVNPFKLLSDFFSERVDGFLFEEKLFNGALGALNTVSRIIMPTNRKGFSYQALMIFLIIAFLVFLSQVV